MSVEDKIKMMFGEQAVQVAMLLDKIDELNKRVIELQKQLETGERASPVH